VSTNTELHPDFYHIDYTHSIHIAAMWWLFYRRQSLRRWVKRRLKS